MKKHLPNILLLFVVLLNIYFMVMYVKNNDLGKFLSTTGVIFLIIGVLIFIFFLSIDPGYGWVKSMDFTKNYIMIFVSMAVSILGIVLIISGERMHELRNQALRNKLRCQEIMSGNAVQVMKEDWFSLRDMIEESPVNIYLFQNKGNRNNYKIVTTINKTAPPLSLNRLQIISSALPAPLIMENKRSLCPEVVEMDIRIDYTRHQQLKEKVLFDVTVVVLKKWSADADSTTITEELQFTLKNSSQVEDAKPKLSYLGLQSMYKLAPAYGD